MNYELHSALSFICLANWSLIQLHCFSYSLILFWLFTNSKFDFIPHSIKTCLSLFIRQLTLLMPVSKNLINRHHCKDSSGTIIHSWLQWLVGWNCRINEMEWFQFLEFNSNFINQKRQLNQTNQNHKPAIQTTFSIPVIHFSLLIGCSFNFSQIRLQLFAPSF